MRYLWTDGVTPIKGQRLQGDIRTEVCVIGGGMAGILCAARLHECGVDTVVAEAKEIGEGITKGTTAVLTAQHDLRYRDLAERYGFAHAKQYLHAHLRALQWIRQQAERIDCDFEVRPSVMFSRTGQDGLRVEADMVRRLGFPAVYTAKPKLPFPAVDAVVYPEMAQFHPLRFLNGMARGLRIYTGTFVRELSGNTAITDSGRIRANHIIVATHFPFVNRRGLYFTKQYQNRSYIIAYRNAPDIGCTAIDAGKGGFYFRNYRDLLLVGGGDHRTGKQGGAYAAIEQYVRRRFPQAKEAYRWANQDCVTLDDVPYIGQYSPAMPNVYVATGFNLWGMTTSAVAADILCDRILGKQNADAAVFASDRSMLHPRLFSNLGAAVAGWLTPVRRRCPHLGCALHYNAAEHSWDCACHGSRFDGDGKLIENPAMRDADV